ncbi:bifunctional enoyl-CoA hydratase/phosphate acetyltransferase [Paramaledivibacter caminithermalis]|jgi:phosphate butyryltransferase|uniref:Phosphate butyryltransferase n=1 Tax=Paramaledivibacter caminithermalis (strain DSM 15212 / CIP 107654 / DViRD3) TaxID=1121301 RepID=A0A1M6SYZ2_PARC5|nr:bifunctional enoyl-CoA hydratase/phosphate acetyltransferase [Paramaledivibacter caminithermalis]SHK49886.1 phosphate butyryltransferase [Paramaledivibacter caminithermalis DSM 15212]
MINNFKELISAAKEQTTMKLAVAAAQDEDVLTAVCGAAEMGIVEPILVGEMVKIKEIADKSNLDITNYVIIEKTDLTEAAREAVKLVSSGKADFVMKGLIDTSILLKAVLDKEIGLRTDSLLSHVMVYQVPSYHKLLFLTDGGMNIAPSIDEKALILRNSVKAAHAMGIESVKVACLTAKEKVSSKMVATIDADKLKEMGANGEFGEGVIVEGPIAFDLAVSKEAAKIKKFESKVAGDADILLVPAIEVGNGIGKALTYMANAESAGIIMGAKAPVVLVSRADSHEAKLNSIALGSVIAAHK